MTTISRSSTDEELAFYWNMTPEAFTQLFTQDRLKEVLNRLNNEMNLKRQISRLFNAIGCPEYDVNGLTRKFRILAKYFELSIQDIENTTGESLSGEEPN